ncbi:hypothetical protein CAOG_01408 [Capsaspora owczarzaki ATCC 30864]|nr:hypothetical protein CAOG_01408 [Capsaspora owczarzaki ATCC 30864]|eukprot:XP_004349928.1 hypothetical protein CAOG_01408 [Capsaspora owczarzaki ATCC 30864]
MPVTAQSCSNDGQVANFAAFQSLLGNPAMTTICLDEQSYAFTSVLTITRSVSIVGFKTNFTLGSTTRFFNIDGNVPLVNISGIAFIATSSSTTASGGSILVGTNTRLVLANLSFAKSSAKTGGALYLGSGSQVEGTSLSFSGCGFTSTASSATGGAVVYLNATSYFSCTACTFKDSAIATYSQGGVFFIGERATVRVYSSTFSNNFGGIAGVAAMDDYAALEAFGSNFTGNDAGDGTSSDGSGGVVYAQDFVSIWFQDCTVSANAAQEGSGGVIFAGASANITLLRSTFTSNTAATDGGVIRTGVSAQIAVVSSTFSQNAASSGAGGVFALEGASSTVTATDSLFNGNQAISGGVLDMISSNTLRASFFRCNFTSNKVAASSGTDLGGGVFRVRNNQLVLVDSSFTNNVRSSVSSLYEVGMIEVDAAGKVAVVSSQLSGNSNTRQYDALLTGASATMLTFQATLTKTADGTAVNEPNLAAFCIDCKAIANFLCSAVPACAYLSSSRIVTPSSLLAPSSSTTSSVSLTLSSTPTSEMTTTMLSSSTPDPTTPATSGPTELSTPPPSSPLSSATPSSQTPLSSSATPANSDPKGSSSSDTTPIVAAVAAAVCAVVVACLVLILILRRRRNNAAAKRRVSRDSNSVPVSTNALVGEFERKASYTAAVREVPNPVYDSLGQSSSTYDDPNNPTYAGLDATYAGLNPTYAGLDPTYEQFGRKSAYDDIKRAPQSSDATQYAAVVQHQHNGSRMSGSIESEYHVPRELASPTYAALDL